MDFLPSVSGSESGLGIDSDTDSDSDPEGRSDPLLMRPPISPPPTCPFRAFRGPPRPFLAFRGPAAGIKAPTASSMPNVQLHPRKTGVIFNIMKTVRYVYWKNDDIWLGYLEDYPDYMTQGKTVKELQENLKDIYEDVRSGVIPGVRKIAELQLA